MNNCVNVEQVETHWRGNFYNFYIHQPVFHNGRTAQVVSMPIDCIEEGKVPIVYDRERGTVYWVNPEKLQAVDGYLAGLF